MTSAYRVSSLPQPDFSEADRKFSALKQQLTSGAFRAMRHSDVERHLLKEGTELMRVLLQAYVTLAGRRKVKGEVVGADGTRRTHVRTSAVSSQKDSPSRSGVSQKHSPRVGDSQNQSPRLTEVGRSFSEGFHCA